MSLSAPSDGRSRPDREWQDRVRGTAGYQEALEYMRIAAGSADTDYEWVAEYAKVRWEELNEEYEAISEKADSIIKYLGGGAGLLALGLIAKGEHLNPGLILAAAPSMLAAIAAIVCAVNIRRPRWMPSLPPVRDAAEVAAAMPTKNESLAVFLGQWHLACQAMRIVCDQQSDRLHGVYRLYVWAVALLAIPVFVATGLPN
jgi:hypothetical protein